MATESQRQHAPGSLPPPSVSELDEKVSQHDAGPAADATDAAPEADAQLALTQTKSGSENYVTGIKLQLVFVALSLVAFLMLLDISIVATATPRITSDFHSLTDVGWYGSAYLLANCALQPLAGKIYTYFNSKIVFLTFFGIFELGSLLCGVAQSSKMLIVSRAVAGLGGAGLMNGALTIISIAVPLPKRPMYMGAMMAIAQMGVVVGPLLGGAFTEYTTWRWCFYINLPIGALVAALLLVISIPTQVKPRTDTVLRTVQTKLDLLGFVLFAPSIIMLLLALEWGGNDYAWNSATVIGLFCGAGANFLVFLAWEWRMGEEAMIPLGMLKIRTVWASCAFMFFFFSMMQVVVYYLPIYFQAVKNASPMMSGVDLLPSILSQLISTVGSGIAITRVGYYLPFAVASAVITSIGHGTLTLLGPHSSIGSWIGYQVIVGFGRGLGMQMPFIAIQNSVSRRLISVSISILTFTQTLGGAVFLSIAQTVFTTSLRTTIPRYAPDIPAQEIIQAGATGVWKTVQDPTDLQNVLIAYNESIRRNYYIAIGCSGICFFLAFGLGWKDIRAKKKPEAGTEEV
ncbi:Major facilitator superfamily domain, general substrate transporter [Cordyceps fumosorosea ARSEF 2679]|uniref:Major facilitator superfamily domain, general substrate transporter n=1 Tax=Cordyceps fumosorosea (strain ARSEF 2679) TaxID=1081104 RepID=A0A167JSX0_CORFA|nr:Major facilitator superfamily domain, general substrate transporter [Cordyceps fumosorosea ARSEF 2679]OAA50707.1 Major facilitator superfamily domain, general substrate transporter [Cordyceps fumosorosea ARSEF 2679]